MRFTDDKNQPPTSWPEEYGALKSQRPGRVERVVPGRLLYVDAASGEGSEPACTLSFPLNRVIILGSSGDVHPYRGEPLSELGLKEGRNVTVVEFKNSQIEPKYSQEGPWVVIDTSLPAGVSTTRKLTDTVTQFLTHKKLDFFK